MDLVLSIIRELDRQNPGVEVISRQMNSIIDAANSIIREFERPYTPAGENVGRDAWLKSDDVGLSSRYLAYMAGLIGYAEYAHPHDSGDFGRCLSLIRACPKAFADLSRLPRDQKTWAKLLASWNELTELHGKGEHSELTRRIRELTETK